MSKLKLKSSEIRKIISESVTKVLKEYYGDPREYREDTKRYGVSGIAWYRPADGEHDDIPVEFDANIDVIGKYDQYTHEFEPEYDFNYAKAVMETGKIENEIQLKEFGNCKLVDIDVNEALPI